MGTLEKVTLISGIAVLAVCFISSIFILVTKKVIVKPVGGGNDAGITRLPFNGMGYLWIGLALLAFVFITISIISRIIASGHGPFSSMYEFAVAFSWSVIAMSLIFLWRYRTIVTGSVGIVIALGLLIFASTLPSRVLPLVPALQQSLLLSVHVAAAVISYGALTVGFGAALIYLIIHRREVTWLPQPEVLEKISYNSVIIGFPFLTLTIILGAVWANIAWGRPWSWDPKETASLVTWLIFAAYLHARIMRGWKGTRTATLLVIGFLAILFTFFGNYIFSGLHSYG